MRKIYLFALIVAMFAASCAKEETKATEENVLMSFSIGVENSMTMSRAISDGSGANQLMYAVFDKDDALVMSKAVKNDVTGMLSEGGYNMTISLAKGHTYKVVFWAQNSECEAYEVSDDMNVTINYKGINNDESRDAFFGITEAFKVEDGGTISVVLKRPFAQVNVGAFPFDLEHVKELGLDIAQSSATFKGIANKINLYTGETEGEVDVTYSLSDMPTEKLLVDVDDNGENEVYEYLSMSYILASKERTLHEMSFEFTEAEGINPVNFSEGLSSVPIQRNWRTNIVGQILTGDITFNIKIDPIYEGETINSAGLYYNFSHETEIKDKIFAFNTNEAATFTSDNESLIKMTNVTFSGSVQYIAMGDYIKRDGVVVVPFKNEMTNVVAKDMVITHSKGITNVEPIDYMAPLIFLRGETTLKDCVFTGATCLAKEYTDYWGDVHEVLPYDCGVPNDCVATFTDCTLGRLYAWSHSQITLTNTTAEYIRCSTHNQTVAKSHLTIGDGSIIDEICITSSNLAKKYNDENDKTHWDPNNMWAPSLIIKDGAKVKKLDMNGRSPYDDKGNLDVIIEEGATIEEIIGLPEGITDIPRTTL